MCDVKESWATLYSKVLIYLNFVKYFSRSVTGRSKSSPQPPLNETASPRPNQPTNNSDGANYEKLLLDLQIQLKMIYLKHEALKGGHEVNLDLLRVRSKELINKEALNIANKLDRMQGHNNSHR